MVLAQVIRNHKKIYNFFLPGHQHDAPKLKLSFNTTPRYLYMYSYMFYCINGILLCQIGIIHTLFPSCTIKFTFAEPELYVSEYKSMNMRIMPWVQIWVPRTRWWVLSSTLLCSEFIGRLQVLAQNPGVQ